MLWSGLVGLAGYGAVKLLENHMLRWCTGILR